MTTTLAAAFMALMATPVLADPPEAGQGEATTPVPPAQPAPGQASVSDPELKEFVKAMKKVESIRMSAQQELANVETPEAAQKIQERATQQMMNAIQKTELSVDRYNEISRHIMQDEALQRRLRGMMDDK